jgi:hypothetical protein
MSSESFWVSDTSLCVSIEELGDDISRLMWSHQVHRHGNLVQVVPGSRRSNPYPFLPGPLPLPYFPVSFSTLIYSFTRSMATILCI